MKYVNALIVVALFMVMAISAMAISPETTNNIGKNAIQGLASISRSLTGYNTGNSGGITEVPEFSVLIIPVATTIGLMFLFQHNKTKEK